jgi:spore coat protein YutH
MFQNLLKKHYGIEAAESTPLGKYPCCKEQNKLYLLVPVENLQQEELEELQQMADYLKNSGDRNTCIFLRTKEETILLESENGKYCVLMIENLQPRTTVKIGRKLAKFHYRGRYINFSVQKTSRIGQWKQLWEKRVDQMEKVWNDMLFQPPESEFDKMFLESFPYYMSIAENAIQYLVDTELDENPEHLDNGTICHTRFTSRTWGNDQIFRNPFDWVFDHCSRDLAEWTRDAYFNHYSTYQHEVYQFFTDYQSVARLTPFAWRLLYARLLFPLHYFECVEDYYSTPSEQQQRFLNEHLEKYLKQSTTQEKFLRHFYQLVEVPTRKYKIPTVDWLSS